jgi:hypothetical protein
VNCGNDPMQVKTNPLAAHNHKVQFLDSLAILLGCMESIENELPDGRRPDIMRMDKKRGLLFIGDAKQTESPGCLTTQVRLLEYFRWLSAHVSRENAVAIFAICFRKVPDTYGWARTVYTLAHEVGLIPLNRGVERFGPGLVVAWFIFRWTC